eukprot:7113695-Prymnesium_polylepis.1
MPAARNERPGGERQRPVGCGAPAGWGLTARPTTRVKGVAAPAVLAAFQKILTRRPQTQTGQLQASMPESAMAYYC